MNIFRYNQKVKIKHIEYDIVCEQFNNLEFVKYLTQFQPVKVLKWDGINNGCEAIFKIWLFKWHVFSVVHDNYNKQENCLSFYDNGTKLPFGIINWNHKHQIEINGKSVVIFDNLKFEHNNLLLALLLYPILISPILIRKILYPLYFKKIKSNYSKL